MKWALGLVLSFAAVWAALLLALLVMRPRKALLREAVRLLPDTLGLLRRLAADPGLSRPVRLRLWLLFAYLALPFDLIPDFIPVLGYADDAVLVAAVLRSVVRRAGPDAVRRHWRGSPDGLATVWTLARLPGSP
jgi:uncharacterized membrane protein YkvA (DUF1232 family)